MGPFERLRADRGYVTAEAAVSVLSLVLLVAMLLWGVMAAVAQLGCVDGAQVGARAAARSEPWAEVRTVVRLAAPRGAKVTLRRDGELLRVRVEKRTFGPGPLALTVGAEAVALAEDRMVRRPRRGRCVAPPRHRRRVASSARIRARRGPRGVADGRRCPRRDQGSASVWTAVCATAICAVLLLVASWSHVLTVRHRAGGAADLAALAAADRALDGPRRACAAARQVADAQGARLVRCQVRGEVADLTAEVRVGPLASRIRARAGPSCGAAQVSDVGC